ncbi:choline transporter, partial [Mycobacterium sp. ITM-2017-0098]
MADISEHEATAVPSRDPVDSVVEPTPHPVLDVPVEEEKFSRSLGMDWVVFGVTAAIAVAFLVWGFVSTDSLAGASSATLTWVMNNTGWLFMLTSTGFVVFVLYLALGRYGTIPLGRDDEPPEFNGISWVAMMFSAGMGIGLMFFGVAEPLSHFTTPPPGTGPEGNAEAVQNAMATTLFHWTLHPWAI